MTNILTGSPKLRLNSNEKLGPLYGPADKNNKRAVSIPSMNRNTR